MEASDLIKQYNQEERDFTKANLSGADLSEAKLDKKWRLVWEIVNQGAVGLDLHSKDLSNTNLYGADLQMSNLMGTNLSQASLESANLQDADLSGANLNNANLQRANLIGAVLDYARVENAKFRDNQGITEGLKKDLVQRGAIFVDDPGSGVLTPH